MLPNINALQKSTKIERLENPPIGVPRYTISGEGYFSVTQILDDGSFDEVDPMRSIHALTLGSVVHLQIENYLKNIDLEANLESVLEEKQLQLYNFLPEATNEDWNQYLHSVQSDYSLEEIVLKNRIKVAFAQFMDFYDSHDLKVVFAEEVIWNPEYLYAGTIDLVCELDDELTIIDHKTSRFVDPTSDISDKYTGQLSAYLQAMKYLENKDNLDVNLNILHLNPVNNSYKFIKREYNFDLFLHSMARFSQDKRSHGKKMSLITKSEINKLYLSKSFPCPDNSCKSKSSFPFLEDQTFLRTNNVKKQIKVSFHDEHNHFAVYHINIHDLSIERSFTKIIEK